MYAKNSSAIKTTEILRWIEYFHTMLIQDQELKHWIENFYGYGSWNAKFWFISYEESGGDVPEDVIERLTYFTKNHPRHEPALCDMRELYREVNARLDGPRAAKYKTLYDHRFGKKAVQHGGWTNLVAFTFGYENKKLPDLLEYQKKTFTSGKREAFIDLYPLPAPHNHAWYYSWVDLPKLEFIRNRTGYQEHVYPDRIAAILQNIRQYKPKVVLMYGMNNIQTLKDSVKSFFPDATFAKANAIKQQIPQYHRAELNGTTLVITTQVPTLRHNRIETGYDWQAFGKLVSLKS